MIAGYVRWSLPERIGLPILALAGLRYPNGHYKPFHDLVEGDAGRSWRRTTSAVMTVRYPAPRRTLLLASFVPAGRFGHRRFSRSDPA